MGRHFDEEALAFVEHPFHRGTEEHTVAQVANPVRRGEFPAIDSRASDGRPDGDSSVARLYPGNPLLEGMQYGIDERTVRRRERIDAATKRACRLEPARDFIQHRRIT